MFKKIKKLFEAVSNKNDIDEKMKRYDALNTYQRSLNTSLGNELSKINRELKEIKSEINGVRSQINALERDNHKLKLAVKGISDGEKIEKQIIDNLKNSGSA